MRNVDIDVVAEEFDPAGVVAVDGAKELSLSLIPFLRWSEGNVGCCVVNDGEGTHPEVINHPRH